MRTLSIVTLGVGLMLCSATLASAQASRTWVSGVGDDANPCSRTAPCKTFAGAISKTAAGGEINTLDSGGFGTVTITKSITIINEGSIGGVLAASVNGFIINAAGIHVVLRGLDVNGFGTGINGIRFLQGASLTVENCRIYGFTGRGIEATNPVASLMLVKDTTISASTSAGILITGPVDTVLNTVRIERSGGPGLRVENGEVTARNSVMAGNVGPGILAAGPGVVNVDNSVLSGNNAAGLRAAGGLIRAGNSTIVGNANGVLSSGGGSVISLGNNAVTGNGIDGVFDSTVPRL
jgi:hypothetical protein